MTIQERIERKQRALARLEAPAARDAEMARCFPLGVGYGRGRKRGSQIEAAISRAKRAERLRREIISLRCRLDRSKSTAPAVERKQRKPIGANHPRRIEQALSIYGRHTLEDGSVLSFESGWDDAKGEAWGRAVMVTPSGERLTQDARSTQGGAMMDAAIALAGKSDM